MALSGMRRGEVMEEEEVKKSTRGFASMSREKLTEIGRKGGIAAHVQGTAHEFTKQEASAAGRIGGRNVSQNREHMSTIGRLGAAARVKRYAERLAEARRPVEKR